jgi:hypothetical protein
MDQRTTIAPAAVSRKTTPTGDARWRVHWKDGAARHIRFMPLDGAAEQDWHTIYKTGAVWEAPAIEDIDYGTTVDMALDGLFLDNSIASSRRICTAEEIATVERWHAALYSTVKRDATTERGEQDSLDLAAERGERHKYDLWPFFTAGVGQNKLDLKVRPLTAEEGTAGFATITTLVGVLTKNKDFKQLCGAKTGTGRTYQLSELLLRAYLFGGWRIRPDYLTAARIVYQTFIIELKLRDLSNDIQQLSALANGKQIRSITPALSVVPFMLAPGRSSHDAAERFKRDASNMRERLDAALGAIGKKYDRFCNEVPTPPQSAERPWYNIGISRLPLSCRLTRPHLRTIPQPYSSIPKFKLKPELAAMQQLAFGPLPKQLPPGAAFRYSGSAEVYRQHPTPPYGAEPLIIWLPQPAHDFGNEVSTNLPPALGLPFANNFQRWSLTWCNHNTLHERGSAPDNSDDDLVSKLEAHTERGDDRINRVADQYAFDSADTAAVPGTEDDDSPILDVRMAPDADDDLFVRDPLF